MQNEELLVKLKHGVQNNKTTAEITQPLLQEGYTLTQINDGLRLAGRDPLAADMPKRSPKWILIGILICVGIVGVVFGFKAIWPPGTKTTIPPQEDIPTAQNEPTNCKTADMTINSNGTYTIEGKTLSCFAQEALTCEPARMTLVRRFASNNAVKTALVDMSRGSDGSCVLAFTGEVGEDRTGQCQFENSAHITAMLKRWENGKANVGGNLITELGDATCVGSFFSEK
ncbi:hypothetical protein HYS00_03870 [Candidatus Microgenomates bacterium]|nr:hypothetical protein [Candidatus Microgenomates bacterium]